MKWEPIEIAPKDGTVILTDEGTGRYLDKKILWGAPTGWFLCTSQGDVPKCADERYSISSIDPCKWIPLPTID
jgi:hypothetical protein